MNYIMLDLEWNQTYQQKALAVQKRIGAHLHGEVIQIGAVKLDGEMNIIGSFSVIVKPTFFCRIHRHVRDLTHISQAMLDRGVPLPEAAESFRRFCGKDFVLLTWGPDDVPMFRENLSAHNIKSAWLDCDYDLQKIYSRQRDGGAKKQRSLEFAMEALGIPQNLPPHDALNDAYFTALVATRLDVVGGVRDYGERGEPYLFDATYGDADIGERGYTSTEEIVASPEFSIPPCPICGAQLATVTRALQGRGHRYRTLCSCEKDGDMFVTIRIAKNCDESLRFRKTITVADPAESEQHKKKLAEATVKRRRRRVRRKKSAKPEPAPAEAG